MEHLLHFDSIASALCQHKHKKQNKNYRKITFKWWIFYTFHWISSCNQSSNQCFPISTTEVRWG